MTNEMKKIRFQIARIEGTRPNFVQIERTEEISETEKKVYVKVKGCKAYAIVREDRVERIFAVV